MESEISRNMKEVVVCFKIKGTDNSHQLFFPRDYSQPYITVKPSVATLSHGFDPFWGSVSRKSRKFFGPLKAIANLMIADLELFYLHNRFPLYKKCQAYTLLHF